MKYVHIKVKKINSLSQLMGPSAEKIVLQMINVSDRILHKELKADKHLLTLINGAVSHELRNPLNALVGQQSSMSEYFECLREILSMITDIQIKE